MPDNNTKSRRHLRVRVDPIKCTAFGFCGEFLPEVFDLDDWGYAWVQRPDVPVTLAEAAYHTAKACPTGAIIVEMVDEPDPRTNASSNGVDRKSKRSR